MQYDLYYQDDKSNKFWTIELVGKGYKISHGRIGSKARETHKEFLSEEETKKKILSLVKSKLKKGYKEGKAPKYQPPEWDKIPMNEKTFWRIIKLLNWKKIGDDEAIIKPCVQALEKMSIENIIRFEDILSKKLYELDAKKYAIELGEYKFEEGKYFSEDNFLYERCVIVANGEEYYYEVLKKPQKFQKDDLEFEALLEIAQEAYELKTDKEWDYDHKEYSYETYSNKEGWDEVE